MTERYEYEVRRTKYGKPAGTTRHSNLTAVGWAVKLATQAGEKTTVYRRKVTISEWEKEA